MEKLKRISFITFIVLSCFLFVFRISRVEKNEIAWDVLGYYLYLPATFVHHDPMLKDITWLKQVNAERNLTGTLYQLTWNKKGEPMYFFLMGMAILYLPFFLLGHFYALIFGFSPDGFSIPYQYSMVLGGIIYTLIGLFYLRKILRCFFNEWISSIVMIIIVFGTNYIHHLTTKDLETVNVLFMFTTLIVWNTIQWHDNFKPKHIIAIGIFFTLMGLVKPSEVFILAIPVFWNVTSFQGLIDKIILLFSHRKPIFIAMGLGLLIALPQMVYWYLKTGKPLFDSYNNPGVGLDFTSPHTFDVLFSYRKGWFIYTPIMIFSLIGFYFTFKQNRKIFYALLIYFLVSFYILSSWSEWWYGAAFSCRPVITAYPILAVTLGYFIAFISQQKRILQALVATSMLFFIFLNQFQWWQLRSYILDPIRTTKEYYWATFLKTHVSEEQRDLLMVYRDFSGKMEFNDQDKYQIISSKIINYQDANNDMILQEDTNKFVRLPKTQEFLLFMEKPYQKITGKDHVWIKVSLDVRFPDVNHGETPLLIRSMYYHNWAYGYNSFEIPADSVINKWTHYEAFYLTPEIRTKKDMLKTYIWNRGKFTMDIDNIKIDVFERK
jgi:hypothetical protein